MKWFACIALSGVMLAGMAIGAAADRQTYCRDFARNEANVHLAGSALIDAGRSAEISRQDRAEWDSRAFADCMAQYEPAAAVAVEAAPSQAAPAKETTEEPAQSAAALPPPEDVKLADVKSASAKPKRAKSIGSLLDRTRQAFAASKPAGLAPGSAAWNAYCARKYVSFDPASGTYLSYGKKRKTCVAPKNKT